VFGSFSCVVSGHAVSKVARFSAVDITLGYAVEAESGHSVGTRPSLEGRGLAVKISFAPPPSLRSSAFSGEASLQSQRSDVAKSDGGQRRQTKVAENRKNVLKLGRMARLRNREPSKRF